MSVLEQGIQYKVNVHMNSNVFDDAPNVTRRALGCAQSCVIEEIIFIELMTSDRKLKASREGSK